MRPVGAFGCTGGDSRWSRVENQLSWHISRHHATFNKDHFTVYPRQRFTFCGISSYGHIFQNYVFFPHGCKGRMVFASGYKKFLYFYSTYAKTAILAMLPLQHFFPACPGIQYHRSAERIYIGYVVPGPLYGQNYLCNGFCAD